MHTQTGTRGQRSSLTQEYRMSPLLCSGAAYIRILSHAQLLGSFSCRSDWPAIRVSDSEQLQAEKVTGRPGICSSQHTGVKIHCGSVSEGLVVDFWHHELGFTVAGVCSGGELVDFLPTRELRTRSKQLHLG